MQEGSAGLLGQGGETGVPCPLTQGRRVAGERQAALDEQADQLLRRAGVGDARVPDDCRQKAGREKGWAAVQRRSSIWIGPSRRPWVNWSTSAIAAVHQTSRRACPDDAAVQQHRRLVADPPGAGHVVGDGDGGAAKPLDAVDDQAVDHRPHDRIEAGGRLIEEHDIGLGGDRSGQGHALLHAARQFGRRQVADAGRQADLLQEIVGPRAGVVAGGLVAGDQPEGDVFPDRQAVEQGAVLEQHADAGSASFALAGGTASGCPGRRSR